MDDDRPIGQRLQGIQHVGLTVQDMARAFATRCCVMQGRT